MDKIYSVVERAGMHDSGDLVRPASTHTSLTEAQSAAREATQEYRERMRAHGGTSGGYRVVEGAGPWLGHELNRVPSVVV